jgi:hypothetical protein
MADRIVVLFEGRVMRELARADATEEAIMHAATGIVEEAGRRLDGAPMKAEVPALPAPERE